MLRSPATALRVDDPFKEVLELGLIMDCTVSMSVWIKRAKETLV